MPTKPKLKPCPFCGCRAEFYELYVHCLNKECQAEGPLGETTKEAIEKWNRRTHADKA
jgi:hypothetical protein